MYVPVDRHKTVHRYAQPKNPSKERTVCNKLIPWVVTLAFVKETDLRCTLCWEDEYA